MWLYSLPDSYLFGIWRPGLPSSFKRKGLFRNTWHHPSIPECVSLPVAWSERELCRGYNGPHDCGHYNSAAWETGFFVSDGGSWNSEYGHFFLSWYSRQLLQHADRVLGAAAAALYKRGRPRKAMAMKEVSLRPRNCSPSFIKVERYEGIRSVLTCCISWASMSLW